MFRKEMEVLCLGWLFCSAFHFLAILPRLQWQSTSNKVILVSSVSRMCTYNFCYASYTGVPSWSCSFLTLQKWAEADRKQHWDCLQELSVYKNQYYFSLALFPWQVFLTALAASPLPLIGSNIRTKGDNCSAEEPEMTEVPLQPRFLDILVYNL